MSIWSVLKLQLVQVKRGSKQELMVQLLSGFQHEHVLRYKACHIGVFIAKCWLSLLNWITIHLHFPPFPFFFFLLLFSRTWLVMEVLAGFLGILVIKLLRCTNPSFLYCNESMVCLVYFALNERIEGHEWRMFNALCFCIALFML